MVVENTIKFKKYLVKNRERKKRLKEYEKKLDEQEREEEERRQGKKRVKFDLWENVRVIG